MTAALKLAPQLPADIIPDPDRLAAVDRYDVLDTPREEAFERITKLMTLVLKTDSSIVSLIDGHRQWYKAAQGAALSEVPVADSFCRITIQGDDPVVVPDATQDPRFSDHPHVTGGMNVRSYIGVPLKTADGHNIGTLCAFGLKPREFSDDQAQILKELAKVTINELELRQLATSDGLTGIMTRRAFKEDAGRYVAHARRHRSRLSAIALDIDHFKAVNDTYGHAAGDQVLKAVTKAVGAQLRHSDLFGRVGGEEFVALLPEADPKGAMEVAEKLRGVIRGLKFPGSHPPMGVSASFGVAAFDPNGDDVDRLLAKADEALYDAKRNGRNRSESWSGTTTSTTKQVVRRRVLKAGKLIFNDRNSTVDCTVRSIWETGADVDVSTTVGIPDEVTLAIRSDGTETKCRITSRRTAGLELTFE